MVSLRRHFVPNPVPPLFGQNRVEAKRRGLLSSIHTRYDGAGNRLEKDAQGAGTTYYTWDDDRRLAEVDADLLTHPVTMTYNPVGKRVRKTIDTEDKAFFYDFNRLLQEYDGSSGDTSFEYTLTVEEYGDLVSEYEETGGSTAYHQYDALGSTDSLLDDDGTVTDGYKYRAFGHVEAHVPDSSTHRPFTFVGRQNYYQDSEIALYLLDARYYDPATGQFISEDPAGPDADAKKNDYRYVGNNPVNETDPRGLQGCPGQSPSPTDPPLQASDLYTLLRYEIGTSVHSYDTCEYNLMRRTDTFNSPRVVVGDFTIVANAYAVQEFGRADDAGAGCQSGNQGSCARHLMGLAQFSQGRQSTIACHQPPWGSLPRQPRPEPDQSRRRRRSSTSRDSAEEMRWYDWLNAEKNGLNRFLGSVEDAVWGWMSEPTTTVEEMRLQERHQFLPTSTELGLPDLRGNEEIRRWHREREAWRERTLTQTPEGRAQLRRELNRQASALAPVTAIPLPPEPVTNRIAAGGQLVLAGVEGVAGIVLIITPEPGTTATGVVVVVIATDQAQTAVRTLWSGEYERTGLSLGADWGMRQAGYSKKTALLVGEGADLTTSLMVGQYSAKKLQNLAKVGRAAKAAEAGEADVILVVMRADDVPAPNGRLLGSIEDAAAFERAHFGNRFVGEDLLSDVQGGLEGVFSQRGLRFEGIFTGQARSQFIPQVSPSGAISGGRIHLVGTGRRQPLIRVLDEVSHALDAANPRYASRMQRLLRLAAADPDRARAFQHFQLFRRVAREYEAGNPVLRVLLQESDVTLLRQLAKEIRR